MQMLSILCMLPMVWGNLELDRSNHNSSPALGSIRWETDFRVSKQRSFLEHKPLLILFTGFQDEEQAAEYGRTVLHNPLIKEAIEENFIPLAINNQDQTDSHNVMNFFHEPHHNLPVIRVYDPASKVPSERLSGDYSGAGLAMTMVVGLTKQGKKPPLYLRILAGEQSCTPDQFWDRAHAPFNRIPMTRNQFKLIRKAVKCGNSPNKYLSPNQRSILRSFKAAPELLSNLEVKKLSKNRCIVELAILLRKRGKA